MGLRLRPCVRDHTQHAHMWRCPASLITPITPSAQSKISLSSPVKDSLELPRRRRCQVGGLDKAALDAWTPVRVQLARSVAHLHSRADESGHAEAL